MTDKSHRHGEPPCFATGAGIICAGLPRSGTASLARALEILGFGPIHHGLQIENSREFYAWGQAAWCNLPHLRASILTSQTARLPHYMSAIDPLLPWTRSDWDRLIGRHRVTTDLGSIFSEQLITAYPEAKVILVERPEDKWMASYRSVLIDGLFTGFHGFVLCTLGPLTNQLGSVVSRDAFFGWLKASSRREAIERMPTAHREHHAMVRGMVPPDQLLDFKLDHGWKPLCEFLEVPIPDVPFPHVNDSKDLLAKRDHVIRAIIIRLGTVATYWTISVASIALFLHEGSRKWIV